ncbi:hypothetical protein [Microbispora sp. CA-102843]|uniref:hypothetical protein n=1 Tax=Microbispora sp. CA-102843 TaxID=3239952 RepID=UPI003D8DF1EA
MAVPPVLAKVFWRIAPLIAGAYVADLLFKLIDRRMPLSEALLDALPIVFKMLAVSCVFLPVIIWQEHREAKKSASGGGLGSGMIARAWAKAVAG